MNYYLYIQNEQRGPYTLSQLRSMWGAGQITAEHLYWEDGQPDWRPLSALVALLDKPINTAQGSPATDKAVSGSSTVGGASDAGTGPCPACGEMIKATAVKCRFCNTDLAAFASSREAEVEKTLFSGRPAVLISFGQYLVVVCTLGIAYFFYWLSNRSIRFEITTQRARIERGLLSKTKDNVELFRIDHFDLHKPLGMRLVGQCLLHLRSSDKNIPEVRLYGIPGLETLADTLRECSLRERTRRRVTAFVQA